MPGATHRRDRGFALLVVLWGISLLALLGTRLTATARVETQLVANMRANAVAEAAAEGGVREAVFRLLQAEAQRWGAEPLGFASEIGAALVTVRVEPLAGRVNPNTAPAGLLAALLRQVGVAPAEALALGNAVAAWRVARPFAGVAGLAEVPGMTPALLAALRPWLSVHNFGAVEARLAAPAVLRALAESGEQQPEASEDYGLLVAVTALAEGRDGGRFTRNAVLRLRQAPPLAPFQVLAWD